MTLIPARKGATSDASPSFSFTSVPTTNIPVVLFDLDDTLLAHTEAVGLGITAHRAHLGGPIAEADDDAEIVRWHALEEKHYHRYLDGELDFLGQRRARVRGFLEPYGIELSDAAADRWYGEYFLEYERSWALHSDVLPCLDSLHQAIPGVRFGLITNGELDYQQPKIEAVGLSPYFEHVIASGELDFAKPDARIFLRACSMFAVSSSSTAYVGDRLHTDAIGAAAAGLTGVWLDRLGIATTADLAAAAASGVPVIRTLVDLPSLLASPHAV